MCNNNPITQTTKIIPWAEQYNHCTKSHLLYSRQYEARYGHASIFHACKNKFPVDKTDCYQDKHHVNATIFGIPRTVVLIDECAFYIDDIHSSPPRIIGFAPIIDRSQKDTTWNDC